MSKRYDKPLTLEQLALLPDDEIDTSDIPELDDKFWANAKLTCGKALNTDPTRGESASEFDPSL